MQSFKLHSSEPADQATATRPRGLHPESLFRWCSPAGKIENPCFTNGQLPSFLPPSLNDTPHVIKPITHPGVMTQGSMDVDFRSKRLSLMI